MRQKPQIVFIHGGEVFSSRKHYLDYLRSREITIGKKVKWSRDYLDKKLGRHFEIIRPDMPLKENARYEDWKIHFEKFFPFLKDNVILIGSSLGSIFLVKYLSENEFPKRLVSVYLVAPPFENTPIDQALNTKGFKLQDDLSRINSKNIRFFFSKDDPVVPVAHAEKYKEKLPDANITIYEIKNGHFRVPEFPELIEMIKADLRKIKKSK